MFNDESLKTHWNGSMCQTSETYESHYSLGVIYLYTAGDKTAK
jgi:hypothetical protein